ncbi:unnamed protein product [Menidia menidia]|uniref:(Atlantic silverside) hypothetical protein n=1 Tax=Menidia menidia TaxID=238744 RepID=A0A8S4AUV4_9TELE|nr:unnamed protein product [Menidia menidia]
MNRSLLLSLFTRCRQILEDTDISEQQMNRTVSNTTCFTGTDEEKKDPYEEFISAGQPSTQTFNTGHMAEKFYFEEESSL